MGPTWPHLGPVGPRWPHVGPMNLALRGNFFPSSSLVAAEVYIITSTAYLFETHLSVVKFETSLMDNEIAKVPKLNPEEPNCILLESRNVQSCRINTSCLQFSGGLRTWNCSLNFDASYPIHFYFLLSLHVDVRIAREAIWLIDQYR